MERMTRKEFMTNCWRFYLMLEKRFLDTTQYVELNHENFRTFSLEYVNLLQSIGSELDVFMKVICGFKQSEIRDINDYYRKIVPKYKKIKAQKVIVNALNKPINPFNNWSSKCPAESLKWWHAYNLVKHGRIENFKLAKLENVLNALAALYLLEMYYLKDIVKEDEMDIPDRESELFALDNWETRFISKKGLMLKVTGEDEFSFGINGRVQNIDGGELE